jgi:hypothetical protein
VLCDPDTPVSDDRTRRSIPARAVAGRVFCSSDPFVGWSHPPRYIGLQFRAVTDRKHHRVGSEMIVSVNATPAVRVRLTRSGGGLWYAFDRCLRNRAPSR